MANQKLTELTATTTPDDDDLAYIVIDPSGTPTSRKMEWRYALDAHDISCQVKRAAAQTIGTGAWTEINWTAENYDTHGFHDNAVNNTRLTVPTGYGGKYVIHAFVRWEANATGRRHLYIRVDDTDYIAATSVSPAVASAFYQSVTVEYELSAGQYVEADVYQNSGGNLDIEVGQVPLMTIRKVG